MLVCVGHLFMCARAGMLVCVGYLFMFGRVHVRACACVQKFKLFDFIGVGLPLAIFMLLYMCIAYGILPAKVKSPGTWINSAIPAHLPWPAKPKAPPHHVACASRGRFHLTLNLAVR